VAAAFNEKYNMTFPDGFARGIIMGPMRFEITGDVVIHCEETGIKANIKFIGKAWIGGDWDCVSGNVTTPPEKVGGKPTVAYTIDGKWNATVSLTPKKGQPIVLTSKGQNRKIRKRVAELSTQEPYFSQVVWAKVTESLKRKDVPAANAAKADVENAQRAERKVREETGGVWETRIFTLDQASRMWMCNKIDTTLLQRPTPPA
jgi:hypothetical protein